MSRGETSAIEAFLLIGISHRLPDIFISINCLSANYISDRERPSQLGRGR
jgi:hypothetical protein